MKVKLGEEYVTLDGSILTITEEPTHWNDNFKGQIDSSGNYTYFYREDGTCWFFEWPDGGGFNMSTSYHKDNYNISQSESRDLSLSLTKKYNLPTSKNMVLENMIQKLFNLTGDKEKIKYIIDSFLNGVGKL